MQKTANKIEKINVKGAFEVRKKEIKIRLPSLLLALVLAFNSMPWAGASASAAEQTEESLAPVPAYYRSEAVTGVRNQHGLDWCQTFAPIAAIESNLVHKGMAEASIDLSESWGPYWETHYYEDPKGAAKVFLYYTDAYAEEDIPEIIAQEQMEHGVTYDHTAVILSGHYGGASNSIIGSIIQNGLIAEERAPLILKNRYAYAFNAEGYVTEELNDVTPHATPADSIVQLNRYISMSSATENRDALKRAIMEYGSGELIFNVDWSAFGKAGVGIGSHYSPDPGGNSHAVQVVGWDDDYSKENFVYTPPGDGAWIVKNSWGVSSNTDKGFNYISYYDSLWSMMTGGTIMFMDATMAGQPDFCDNRYAYGWYALPFEQVTTQAYGAANIFTVKTADGVRQERLKAVAFKSEEDAAAYTLRIYKNPQSGPVSGTLIYEQPVLLQHRGYYRLPLEEEYWIRGQDGLLADGQSFSVVLTAGAPFGAYFYEAFPESISPSPGYESVDTHVHDGRDSVSRRNLVYQGRLVSRSETSGKSYIFSSANDGSAALFEGSALLDAFTDDVRAALTSIRISTPPDKTDYVDGESFSSQGMVVTARYADGSERVVGRYIIVRNAKLRLGDSGVTVSYSEGGVTRTAVQPVAVSAAPPEFTGDFMPVGKVKTAYSEKLPVSGSAPMNFALMDGALPRGLRLDEASGEISGVPQEHGEFVFTVRVSNAAGSAEAELYLRIYSDVRQLDRIEVISQQRKFEYIEGELFDPTGLVVMAYYTNGDSADVTDKIVFSPVGPLSETEKYIYIRYTEDGITVETETYVLVRQGELPLSLSFAVQNESGELAETDVVKILRPQGWAHADTGEPTNRGYDPTQTARTVYVMRDGEPMDSAAEHSDLLVRELLAGARYDRCTWRGPERLDAEAVREYLDICTDSSGEYLGISFTSKAHGAVKITFPDGSELLVVTPGDINLDGEMNANDWANIMRWTLQAEGRYDTRPEDEEYRIAVGGREYNLWALLADMTDTDAITSDRNEWRKKVDATDWITIMYLTLQAWKR